MLGPPLVFPSEDAGPRLDVAGGRIVVREGFSEVVPDISRADMSRLQFGVLPHNPDLESMVDGLFPVGSKEAKQYFGDKKIVVRNLQDGTRVASVTSNVWEKVTETHPVSLEKQRPGLGGLGQVRKYQLAQVLTDSYLIEKFSIPVRQLTTVKTMAVVNAESAASYLQSLIRATPGFEKYEVSAGSYSRSKKWARDKILSAKSDPSLVPACIESLVIGDKLYLYGPGDEATRWCVFGPIWYAAEVRGMYSVVAYAGPSQTCFAYGIELTLLDIDIKVGNQVLSPSVELHVGSQAALPTSSSAVTERLLSLDGKMKLLSMVRSMETVEVDGDEVACAVRLTSDRVLINDHVLTSGDSVKIGSETVATRTHVSRDLWIASAKHRECQMEWTLRAPVVGESVVVCYLRSGRLQYTSPMSVRTTDGSMIVTSLTADLKPGMSGGALIALHDMALLGVYSGAGVQQAFSAAFTQVHYTDMCSVDAESDVRRAEAASASGDTLYSRMQSRGFGKLFDAAIQSIEPLFMDSRHVGMAYRVGGELWTTCQPVGDRFFVGLDRSERKFEPGVSSGFVSRGVSTSVLRGPVVRRDPDPHESVFIVGVDDNGPYVSDVVKVVLAVEDGVFTTTAVNALGHLPLAGGLVVAEADGAVVGQCRGVRGGLMGKLRFECVAVANLGSLSKDEVVETFSQWLGRQFPLLSPDVWPVGEAKAVLDVSDTGSFEEGAPACDRPLAFLGAAAARLALGTSLRAHKVPFSDWQALVVLFQSEGALAGVADRVGLSDWVAETCSQVTGGLSVCAKASAMLALLATVFANEVYSTFEQFCEAVGVVSSEYSFTHEAS